MMMKSKIWFTYFLFLFLLLLGCQIPHSFHEDPDGYSEFERCGTCGMTFEEGWHLKYSENDPDHTIESIEKSVDGNQ